MNYEAARDWSIFAVVITPMVLCVGGIVAVNVDEADVPKPSTTQSPTPMYSCYRAGSYPMSSADPTDPRPGGYRPCERPQSIEDEERAHIEDVQRSQEAAKMRQDEIDNDEYWKQVRRERLEREERGETPGGPVTVPAPVPLPS